MTVRFKRASLEEVLEKLFGDISIRNDNAKRKKPKFEKPFDLNKPQPRDLNVYPGD